MAEKKELDDVYSSDLFSMTIIEKEEPKEPILPVITEEESTDIDNIENVEYSFEQGPKVLYSDDSQASPREVVANPQSPNKKKTIISEAGYQARKKYAQNKVKQLNVSFFPKDYDVFEALKQKALEYGGKNKYIIDLVKKDLGL